MKLTTSELKNHLLLDHSSNPSVCAAYLLDEAQKMVNVTPRQCITKYAKATSKQEGHMDHHIRGSYHDVNLNRALTHWLSCANLPYNVLDGGVFMNWCYAMNPRYRVASMPYIQLCMPSFSIVVGSFLLHIHAPRFRRENSAANPVFLKVRTQFYKFSIFISFYLNVIKAVLNFFQWLQVQGHQHPTKFPYLQIVEIGCGETQLLDFSEDCLP